MRASKHLHDAGILLQEEFTKLTPRSAGIIREEFDLLNKVQIVVLIKQFASVLHFPVLCYCLFAGGIM